MRKINRVNALWCIGVAVAVKFIRSFPSRRLYAVSRLMSHGRK